MSTMSTLPDHGFIRKTDSYKVGHDSMYPDNTQEVYTYGGPRNGALHKVFPKFGLQYILKRHFVGETFNEAQLERHIKRSATHFGNTDVCNAEGLRKLLRKHKGRLPLRIRALPEGMLIKPGIAIYDVVNTDPDFAGLTNYSETLLSQVWYPTAVCATSYAMKMVIVRYLLKTCGHLDPIRFMLHDFGFRGATCYEAAGIGGMAHLVNFYGTDTMPGMDFAEDFYGANPDNIGFSVPATEHSIMTSMGRSGEVELVGNLLRKYPRGILSLVIDSFDPYNFVSKVCGEVYRELILARDGIVVLRPDSVTPIHPTPEEEMVDLMNRAWDAFGGTINAKGYRVLDSHVRFLWGDGIDVNGGERIFEAITEAGYCATNIATLGMGGGLLQKVNRDTERWAMKAAEQIRNGVAHACAKDTLDPSKRSMAGRLKTIRNHDGELETVSIHAPGEDLMVPVFENGELLVEHTFDEIRTRAGF